MSEYPWVMAALLITRGVAHLLIAVRVATYMASHPVSHRKVVGYCAGLFAGFNIAEAIRIASNFKAYVESAEPYLPGIIVMVLIFVTWSGGNMAKFLPRKLIDRLP